MKESTKRTLQVIKALPKIIEYSPGAFSSSKDIRHNLRAIGIFASYKVIGMAMGYLRYKRVKFNDVRGFANVSIQSSKERE